MGNILDFNDIGACERTIKNTWKHFRKQLAQEIFSYREIDKAKEEVFLKQYDDLFNKNLGIEYITTTIKEIKSKKIGRGTILREDEVVCYDRFLPKKEFIKADNRFSPPGIEWLYLALGDDSDIRKCAVAECRAKSGDRFGFCEFQFNTDYDECKLIDLTIADNITYEEINAKFEQYVQSLAKKCVDYALKFGRKPNIENEIKKKSTQWGVYTYAKLLSEQIFEPLDESDNKSIMYAPFQTIAQYYISLGYSGIIFGSTVCSESKNIVLFDKYMAVPIGAIEDFVVSS